MVDHTLPPEERELPPELEAFEKPKPRSNRYVSWLVGLGTVGLLVGLGVPLVRTQLTPSGDAAEAREEALVVETLTLEPVSSYAVSRTYTGEIAAVRSSDLGFERSGELVGVLVEDGDRVSAGQRLAQLDIRNLETQKRQLEAQRAEAQARLLELERGARQEDIAAAQAEVRDLENQFRLQETQRARREALYNEGAIARDELDEFAFGAEALQARLDRARSSLNELLNGTRPEQVAAQQAVVAQLDASIGDVDVNIDKSTLRASFDGFVSARQVDEGSVVSAGQSVVQIVEAAVPEARIGIPATVVDDLQVGSGQTVAVNGLPYAAEVQAVLPQVEASTRTQTVVLRLDPAAVGKIEPGQTARLTVDETIQAEGYWLPTEALTQGIRGLWTCYVLVPARPEAMLNAEVGAAADGSAPSRTARDGEDRPMVVEQRSVEIIHEESSGGADSQTRVLVRGTLQPDEQVVSSGIHRLVPGQPVSAIAAN